ncbi:hypothetical protein [Rhodococcus sp. (in: high G+C Gram-positive bacteria)]|nr:hypothetical protein [Rhodococcus sp. (in: high G+C Gram-positive bacteria)]MBQ7803959.1 hypothetical protein [Rhodococcus sp. (in: high G+C Gram-positive bacteria)]
MGRNRHKASLVHGSLFSIGSHLQSGVVTTFLDTSILRRGPKENIGAGT